MLEPWRKVTRDRMSGVGAVPKGWLSGKMFDHGVVVCWLLIS